MRKSRLRLDRSNLKLCRHHVWILPLSFHPFHSLHQNGSTFSTGAVLIPRKLHPASHPLRSAIRLSVRILPSNLSLPGHHSLRGYDRREHTFVQCRLDATRFTQVLDAPVFPPNFAQSRHPANTDAVLVHNFEHDGHHRYGQGARAEHTF